MDRQQLHGVPTKTPSERGKEEQGVLLSNRQRLKIANGHEDGKENDKEPGDDGLPAIKDGDRKNETKKLFNIWNSRDTKARKTAKERRTHLG